MPTRNVVLTKHQEKLLKNLVATGRYQNASEVLREGLRLVRKAHSTVSAAHRIIGTGKFRSGIPDLATNKKYLEDFGR